MLIIPLLYKIKGEFLYGNYFPLALKLIYNIKRKEVIKYAGIFEFYKRKGKGKGGK
ncbi:MAG: hypothetical protein IJX24_02030 [Oscillospiraceae bacterium]|nr:hypothetical protein [Oscillospiraceae bacterium]